VYDATVSPEIGYRLYQSMLLELKVIIH